MNESGSGHTLRTRLTAAASHQVDEISASKVIQERGGKARLAHQHEEAALALASAPIEFLGQKVFHSGDAH